MDKPTLEVDSPLAVAKLSPEDQNALRWLREKFIKGLDHPFRDDPHEEELQTS